MSNSNSNMNNEYYSIPVGYAYKYNNLIATFYIEDCEFGRYISAVDINGHVRMQHVSTTLRESLNDILNTEQIGISWVLSDVRAWSNDNNIPNVTYIYDEPLLINTWLELQNMYGIIDFNIIDIRHVFVDEFDASPALLASPNESELEDEMTGILVGKKRKRDEINNMYENDDSYESDETEETNDSDETNDGDETEETNESDNYVHAVGATHYLGYDADDNAPPLIRVDVIEVVSNNYLDKIKKIHEMHISQVQNALNNAIRREKRRKLFESLMATNRFSKRIATNKFQNRRYERIANLKK